MRALNTTGRKIVTADCTISGSAGGRSGRSADLFSLHNYGMVSVGTSGIAGAAYKQPVTATAAQTIQMTDGTSISFSAVKLPVAQEIA